MIHASCTTVVHLMKWIEPDDCTEVEIWDGAFSYAGCEKKIIDQEHLNTKSDLGDVGHQLLMYGSTF